DDPLGLGRPVEIDRQAREELRPQPRVAVAEAVERLLEELDAGLVDDLAPHPEQARALPGETERAASQQRRVSDPSRDLGGLLERLARPAPVAGFPLHVAAPEQELAALPPGSRTTISRARAGPSVSRSASGSSPHARCRMARSNSRPTTDASARASRAGGGKGARRRRIASRTPCGTGNLPGLGSSCRSSARSATSKRTISSTKKGLPSVSRWPARTSTAAGLRPIVSSRKRRPPPSPRRPS